MALLEEVEGVEAGGDDTREECQHGSGQLTLHSRVLHARHQHAVALRLSGGGCVVGGFVVVGFWWCGSSYGWLWMVVGGCVGGRGWCGWLWEWRVVVGCGMDWWL